MKAIFIVVMLFLLSCTSFKNEIIVNDSNYVVPVLFEAWQDKRISFIEKKLGSPTTIQKVENLIIYSYKDSVVKNFTLLTVKTNKAGDILSLYYVLSDDNTKIKKDWILTHFSNYKWREAKLPITNHHAIVQKVVLLNDEKKISVGFIEGYKNNQIEYVYFDIDGDSYKSKKLFFWE